MVRNVTNRESIRRVLAELDSPQHGTRFHAAKTLGSLARSKPSMHERVLQALKRVRENDPRPLVRTAADLSIRELRGEYDETSEKYNPQVPRGSLSDQYYLRRG